MSRHFQTLAGIGLALGGTLVPSVASAQYNRVPDPNAKRVMVAVFRSGDKGLGVQAADAVRSRMTSEFPFKQVYVLPKQDITATLEASGFPVTEALEPHDQKALATLLRADEYVTGTVSKGPDGVKVEANLVLARDNALVQPLGTYDAKSVGEASSLIAKELKEARKQLEFEQKCTNTGRQGQFDAAIAAAKEGITAYPKSTLVRICWANVLISQKAPAAQRLEVAKEIVAVDAKSRPGLAVMAQAYKELGERDSAVVTLTKLLATDPKNPRLQKDVVDELMSANPKVARPVIDQAVEANPGDPDLLRTRWIILLSQGDFKAAFAQGEELVKLDTSFADTTYFIRTARAYTTDSQPKLGAEFASKGLAKFPNQPSLVYEQIMSLKNSGQLQQALESLDKAEGAKVAVDNSAALRVTLLKELGKEVLPAIKAAIAAGDTTQNIRVLALQAGNDAYRKAVTSKNLDDFTAAVDVLKYAESVAPNSLKPQAIFLLGATYVQFGQAKLTAADAAKSCPLTKEAKDLFVEAQIMLPRGGSFAPDQMRTLMGAVMQLDPAADARIKVYCK
ncbi:tetratricopeptide repeat protein [Gemmatimonas sp.]|uniref:tetratricopeptide repeat protein n=1 Tax=Gemmatimonas sp. TaxID=1962908 RepID=UPI003F71998F